LCCSCLNPPTGGDFSYISLSMLKADALEPCLDELTDVSAQLDLYEAYCVKYSKAVSAYAHEANFNRRLKKFLQTPDCIGALRGGALETYLIKPVQRLCRYPLLLDAMKEQLPSTLSSGVKAAFDDCKAVRDHFSRVISNVNDAKRRSEQLSLMAQVHDRLRWGEEEDSISLAENHRELLKVGTVHALNSTNDSNSVHSRLLMLYNDVLLITLARKSWMNLHPGLKLYDVFYVLPLKDASIRVRKYMNKEEAQSLVHTNDAIKIRNYSWGESLSEWVFGFDTEYEYSQWADCIDKACKYASSRKESSSLLENLMEKTNRQSESSFLRQMNRAKYKVVRVFDKVHHTSAVTIQRTFRGLLGRRAAIERKTEIQAQVKATIVIQNAYRKFKKPLH